MNERKQKISSLEDSTSTKQNEDDEVNAGTIRSGNSNFQTYPSMDSSHHPSHPTSSYRNSSLPVSTSFRHSQPHSSYYDSYYYNSYYDRNYNSYYYNSYYDRNYNSYYYNPYHSRSNEYRNEEEKNYNDSREWNDRNYHSSTFNNPPTTDQKDYPNDKKTTNDNKEDDTSGRHNSRCSYEYNQSNNHRHKTKKYYVEHSHSHDKNWDRRMHKTENDIHSCPHPSKVPRQPSSYGNYRKGHFQTYKRYKVPENWIDVPNCGKEIGSSRLIAMKVPLNSMHTSVNEKNRWLPSEFIEYQKEKGWNVRLIIDLTNTSRYYDPQDFHAHGIEHVKIAVEGKMTPKRKVVAQFNRILKKFLCSTQDDATFSHVAIHCTHGLNRTGFLIVCYLVEELLMTLDDAIQAFFEARPPGIVRHTYLDSLYEMYNVPKPSSYPPLPDWALVKYSC